jgi:lipoate-protein ligase A
VQVKASRESITQRTHATGLMLNFPWRCTVQFLDLTLPTPEENLALDEALLLSAEAGDKAEFFRVWESLSNFVVLGKNCRVADDVWIENSQSDAVPILRRPSGGGTVLLGPGCLNFTLVLRFDRSPRLESVQHSFEYVLDRLLDALLSFEPRVARAGESDIAIDNRKICGNAQRRQHSHFLHHGSILYRFDSSLATRYLREPKRQPAYRSGRDHRAFLTNVSVDPKLLRERLRVAWNATDSMQIWPRELVQELISKKYARTAWNYRC